jgi:hypothetical protein
MSFFSRLTSNLLAAFERHARSEGSELRKTSYGKIELLGIAIGVAIVILVGLWLAHQP